MSDFVLRNKPDWDELESLVNKARRSIKSMSVDELSRLDVLYRRTTVHLSQVVSRTTDQRLASYLNGLTAAAHSLIYLPPRRSIWKGGIRFLAVGFAQSVARAWKFHLLSALALFTGAIIAYFAAMNDVLAAYALLPPGDVRAPGASQEQLLEVLRSGRDMSSGNKFFFASFLFSHNLKVGFLALATGVLAAVPTILLMIYNGAILGSFTAVHHSAGIYSEFWAWILPHGITEIGAIILCGGVGLRLGQAVIAPGKMSRGESLKEGGMEAALTLIGVALMLLAAAFIESYLRQSHLSTAGRFIFAGATGLFWIVYFGIGAFLSRQQETLNDINDETVQIDPETT